MPARRYLHHGQLSKVHAGIFLPHPLQRIVKLQWRYSGRLKTGQRRRRKEEIVQLSANRPTRFIAAPKLTLQGDNTGPNLVLEANRINRLDKLLLTEVELK